MFKWCFKKIPKQNFPNFFKFVFVSVRKQWINWIVSFSFSRTIIFKQFSMNLKVNLFNGNVVVLTINGKVRSDPCVWWTFSFGFVYKKTRNYDVADVTSLPSALKNLVDLFGSEPMFTILGSLTGLTSENDDDQDEDSAYEPSPKKQKSSNESQLNISSVRELNKNQKNFLLLAASSSSSLPRWSFELRRWKHSYYSLSFDTDSKDENNDEGGLDVMIFFNSHLGLTFDRCLIFSS